MRELLIAAAGGAAAVAGGWLAKLAVRFVYGKAREVVELVREFQAFLQSRHQAGRPLPGRVTGGRVGAPPVEALQDPEVHRPTTRPGSP